MPLHITLSALFYNNFFCSILEYPDACSLGLPDEDYSKFQIKDTIGNVLEVAVKKHEK